MPTNPKPTPLPEGVEEALHNLETLDRFRVEYLPELAHIRGAFASLSERIERAEAAFRAESEAEAAEMKRRIAAEATISRLSECVGELEAVVDLARDYAGYDPNLFLTTSSPEEADWFHSSMRDSQRKLKAGLASISNPKGGESE